MKMVSEERNEIIFSRGRNWRGKDRAGVCWLGWGGGGGGTKK